MGFNVRTVLSDVEYRGIQTGQGKNGPWMSLILEDSSEGTIRNVNVSVPQELQSDIYNKGLQKGEVLTICVRAISGDGYGYLKYEGIIERPGVAVDSSALEY